MRTTRRWPRKRASTSARSRAPRRPARWNFSTDPGLATDDDQGAHRGRLGPGAPGADRAARRRSGDRGGGHRRRPVHRARAHQGAQARRAHPGRRDAAHGRAHVHREPDALAPDAGGDGVLAHRGRRRRDPAGAGTRRGGLRHQAEDRRRRRPARLRRGTARQGQGRRTGAPAGTAPRGRAGSGGAAGRGRDRLSHHRPPARDRRQRRRHRGDPRGAAADAARRTRHRDHPAHPRRVLARVRAAHGPAVRDARLRGRGRPADRSRPCLRRARRAPPRGGAQRRALAVPDHRYRLQKGYSCWIMQVKRRLAYQQHPSGVKSATTVRPNSRQFFIPLSWQRGDRGDVIIGMLQAHQSANYPQLAGIVLTAGHSLNPSIARLIEGLPDPLPILSVTTDTYTTAERIHEVQTTLTSTDYDKINLSLQLFHSNINLDRLPVERHRGRVPQAVQPCPLQLALALPRIDG